MFTFIEGRNSEYKLSRAALPSDPEKEERKEAKKQEKKKLGFLSRYFCGVNNWIFM